jgi:hypothetical protein
MSVPAGDPPTACACGAGWAWGSMTA